MIKLFGVLCLLFFIGACSSKKAPKVDITNTKMMMGRIDTAEIKSHTPLELLNVKGKYRDLQLLLKDERYEEAEYLSREIEADVRLIEKRSQRKILEKELEALQGEVNAIKKDFVSLENNESEELKR